MVFEKVRALIAEQFDIDEDKITMDSDVLDDFELDSMDIVDLIMTLEEEYEIEVPDEDVEELRKISGIVKYIEDRI